MLPMALDVVKDYRFQGCDVPAASAFARGSSSAFCGNILAVGNLLQYRYAEALHLA